jgi:putative transposase
LDGVSDTVVDGRRFGVAVVVDDVSRECPALAVGSSLSGAGVAREHDRHADLRSLPVMIVSDTGTEFTRRAMLAWQKERGTALHCIAPGELVQHAFVESLNGRFRDDWLERAHPCELARGLTDHQSVAGIPSAGLKRT